MTLEMGLIMWMLFLEAGAALLLLVFIVWWTMFAGKREDHDRQHDPASSKNDASRESK
jgi:hypothetical protein